MRTEMDEGARKTLEELRKNAKTLGRICNNVYYFSNPQCFFDTEGKTQIRRLQGLADANRLFTPQLRDLVREGIFYSLLYEGEGWDCVNLDYIENEVWKLLDLFNVDIALWDKYGGKAYRRAKKLWKEGMKADAYKVIAAEEDSIKADWDTSSYTNLGFRDDLAALIKPLMDIIDYYHEEIEPLEGYLLQPFQDSAPTTPPQTATTSTPTQTDSDHKQTPPICGKNAFLAGLREAVGAYSNNVKRLLDSAVKGGWLLEDYLYNPDKLKCKAWRKYFAEAFFKSLGVEHGFRWKLFETYWRDAGYRGVCNVGKKITDEINSWMEKQGITQPL